MCDLFLVVALHCVCLFCIFMRKNSRKINMVIGQTPMPATPINVNIFFVLKKVPAFLQFTVHARKTSKLRAAEFLAIGHQTKQIFFVCVQQSIIIAVPPTSLSLQYFTQPATVYSTKMEHFFTLSGLTNLRPNPSFQTFFQELSLTDDCDGRLPTIWFFETSDFERLKNTVRFRRCTQFKGRSQGYVEKSQHYYEATESAL